MPNHLAGETSPYLLQHADNPVEWYPWGKDALELAAQLDKPILLSIGYAACHWCHVMAHESFEDEETAAMMNKQFVNIKVDREERPDLDSIYMDAVVSMTGQGGWPMTVILTPEGAPFYGGTYYPPQPRHGLPSFMQVLTTVADAWNQRREEINKSAADITSHISRKYSLEAASSELDIKLLENAKQSLSKRFDSREGGFGSAPKFPQPMVVEFLLAENLRSGDSFALHMAELTLKKMANGGIYDQLGGGFARYSTDNRWLVPHFEKMLYDNAQLARVYLHCWQVTGDPFYKRIVEETLDYVLLEMRHDNGAFYSSQDADSEGVEGKFYVWSSEEIRNALDEDAELILEYFGVSDHGNWEGVNILNVPLDPADVASSYQITTEQLSQRLRSARKKLYDIRALRVWPGLDDKAITAWNGLMLAAFAEAGSVLDRPDYTAAAVANAEFLFKTMRTQEGRLLRTWRNRGSAKYNGFLEDYAYLAEGLLALYQATFEERWFTWAGNLIELMLLHFRDQKGGGFFDTSNDHEQLIHRPKDIQDNALPSGNAMAVTALLKLSLLTGVHDYWEIAESAVTSMGPTLVEAPSGFAQWLTAASFILGDPKELAIIGQLSQSDTTALLKVTLAGYHPHLVVALGQESGDQKVPLLRQRKSVDGRATAYLCRRFVCSAPVASPGELQALLDIS